MKIVLSSGTIINEDELDLIEGGGWKQFGYATIGVLAVANAPLVAATAGVGAGLIAAGTGLVALGSL